MNGAPVLLTGSNGLNRRPRRTRIALVVDLLVEAIVRPPMEDLAVAGDMVAGILEGLEKGVKVNLYGHM